MLSTRVPPGPAGAGRHGNRRAFEWDHLGFLLDQQQYGDVVRFDDDLYIVNSPVLAEEVLKHTNTTYAISSDLLGEATDGSRASEDLALWMRARSLAGRGLNRTSLRAADDSLASTVVRHAETWRARGRIEAIPALEDLTAHLIAEFCLGPETGSVPDRLARLQDALLPPTLPLPARWHSLRKRRLQRAGRDLADEVSYLIRRRRTTRRDDSPSVVADLLNTAGDEGAITHEGATSVIVANLFAAHETTAAALAWLLLLLDRHPEVHQRVRDEADRELAGRLPTAVDVPQLAFTEAVVKETLRLYPPLWLLRRTVEEPTELAGYPLQPGQSVAVSPFALHRDPHHYHQPTAFNPDRWIDRPANPLPKYAFMPFGGGPRNCLGTHFATTAMTIATATLARHYAITQSPGTSTVFSTRTILQPHNLTLDVTHRPHPPGHRPGDRQPTTSAQPHDDQAARCPFTGTPPSGLPQAPQRT
ncbi:cytochrome P450 [Streptomyces sp. ISL-43]|uniref:cytochrome P450 n=1 Tax=Streptomyces sp. ISL-43 TaxID=2819183 RepID=UPI001BE6712A|nr:cytochrome P450 [Streptomyces sp. ISL-43]MBT2448618.1 cytochrome P450 [Streptomyces sp. ISL-43]